MRIQLDYTNGHSLTAAAGAGTLGGTGTDADLITFNGVAGIADAADLSVVEAGSGGGQSGAPDFDALLTSIKVVDASNWSLNTPAMEAYGASKGFGTDDGADQNSDGITDYQYDFMRGALESMYHEGNAIVDVNSNNTLVTFTSSEFKLSLHSQDAVDNSSIFTVTTDPHSGMQQITGNVLYIELHSADGAASYAASNQAANLSVDLGTLLPLTEGGHEPAVYPASSSDYTGSIFETFETETWDPTKINPDSTT